VDCVEAGAEAARRDLGRVLINRQPNNIGPGSDTRDIVNWDSVSSALGSSVEKVGEEMRQEVHEATPPTKRTPSPRPSDRVFPEEGMKVIRSLILIACALAALALLIATIGANTRDHYRSRALGRMAWISIAASLLAIVLGELWPRNRNPEC
jgi:hypothetical protein